jgi:RNA polymerase sigma-70 factor, ECF subfamily
VNYFTSSSAAWAYIPEQDKTFQALGMAIMQYSHSVPVTTAGRSVAAVQTSDQALVQLTAAGDQEALQVLFTRHNVRVYRFILRLLGDESVAEDLVSEVFLDVWRQAGRFEGRSAVSTWLLSIARFKALSGLRRRLHHELDDETAEAIDDSADNPEEALAKKDRCAIIRKCLEGLSADHREIIDLVYYHEKSIAEVAKITRIPQNTVKTRMFYARQRIARMLAARGFERSLL